MWLDLTGTVTPWKRVVVLVGCTVCIALLVLAEQNLGQDIPLGGLFLIPLAVGAAFVSRWSIFIIALATAILRERLGPFSGSPLAPERLALSAVAFTGGGLFAGELIRNRRLAVEFLQKSRSEARLRSEAEQETRALVESSPAGVLTIDSQGKIARANAAARRMLGFDKESPEGQPVDLFVPLLAKLLQNAGISDLTHTTVEASARRRNGEPFFTQAWVSAYKAVSGPCLAVILLDVTEQIRDREEGGLKQLLSNSKIVAGAVSHELRNLAAAAAVLHHNLSKSLRIQENPDFQALGTVIETAVKIASTELSDASEQAMDGLDVSDLLQELRAIISPGLEDAGIKSEWEIHSGLPLVRAERSGLLQVFLNLAKNSSSALQDRYDSRLRFAAYELSGSVVIRISDNGPGISSAERLFQPFQPGASATGLGLFVSRAMIRTFGGELHHRQQPGECSFIVELPPIAKPMAVKG